MGIKLKNIVDQQSEEILNLLANSDLNISEIAYNLGYEDPKYFSKCFKLHYGMTPKTYRAKSVKSPQMDGENMHPFVDKAIANIESKINNDVYSSIQLADELNVSQATLYRKIKSITGLSPCALIKKIRINKAKQMMLNNNVRIHEIAFSVGFNDTGYFIKCFKDLNGITPLSFLKTLNAG